MIEEIIKEYPVLGIEDFDMSSQEEDAVLIIIKSGIDKLIKEYNIDFQLLSTDLRPYNYVSRQGYHEVGFAASVSIEAIMDKKYHHEVGSCHHKNSDYNYELEVAYKRAKSRAVLELTGLKEKFPVISKDEHYERIRKKDLNKAVEDQLRQDMTEQDIQRSEEVRANIKSRIDSKLDAQDQVRTAIQSEGSKQKAAQEQSEKNEH